MNRRNVLYGTFVIFGLLALFQLLSCIRPPFYYSMDENLPIEEKDIADVAGEILDKLQEAEFILGENDPTDLVPGATIITYKACILAYKIWVEGHYDQGLIPTVIINGLEYTDPKTPNYQEYAGCPAVDMMEQYLEAASEAIRKNKNLGKAIPIKFANQGEAFSEDICLRRFVNEDSQLVDLLDMSLIVTKNTLNVPGPKYELYFYTRKIDTEELEEEGAKEKLILDGALFKFGDTRAITPGFFGELKADLIDDEIKVSQALTNIINFGMVAWPGEVIANSTPIKRGGEKFFIVPQGKVDAHMRLNLELTLTSNFFACLRREKIKEWKEDQKIRQEEYEEELKEKEQNKGKDNDED